VYKDTLDYPPRSLYFSFIIIIFLIIKTHIQTHFFFNKSLI